MIGKRGDSYGVRKPISCHQRNFKKTTEAMMCLIFLILFGEIHRLHARQRWENGYHPRFVDVGPAPRCFSAGNGNFSNTFEFKTPDRPFCAPEPDTSLFAQFDIVLDFCLRTSEKTSVHPDSVSTATRTTEVNLLFWAGQKNDGVNVSEKETNIFYRNIYLIYIYNY